MSAQRELQIKKLRREAPSRTAKMDAAQTTTNSYALIDASVLDVTGHNTVRYVLEEMNTNAIDAKLVGRVKDDDGNFSSWEDVAGSSASTTSLNNASAVLQPDAVAYDQMGVMVTSNTNDAHGDAMCKGLSSRR